MNLCSLHVYASYTCCPLAFLINFFFTTSTFFYDFNFPARLQLFYTTSPFFYDLNFFSRLQHSGTTLTFQHDFNFPERLLLNNAYKCLRWDWMSSSQNFMGIRLWWNVNNQIVFVLTHVKQFYWRFKEKQSQSDGSCL